MLGAYGRSAGSISRGAFGNADNMASTLILLALLIAIISAIIVVYQCGFLSSYAHSTRDKAAYLQQHHHHSASPGSTYFNGLAACAIKSQQQNFNGLTMGSQHGHDFRSPFSTLRAPATPQQMVGQPNSLLGGRVGTLMNKGKQQTGGESNIYQLEPTSQANNNNMNAALCKEYETQMLKMSVLFDDSHSIDDQNSHDNCINKNHLA